MDFFKVFPPEPGPADEPADPLQDIRPGPWVGGVLPVEVVVGLSNSAAVVAGRIIAYPDGFRIEVTTYLHRSVRIPDGPPWHLGLMGHRVPGQGRGVPDEMLRFGLAWPDGRQATNLDDWDRWPPPEPEESGHGLEINGGGGSQNEFRADCWAWPVPGPGDLQVVVAWPAYGIAETRTTLDGAAIAEAAARARPVWPEDAGKPSHLTRAQFHRAATSAQPHLWARGSSGETSVTPLD